VITAVETNTLIDILEPDPVHGLRSEEAMKKCLREGAVVACDVVWAEVATAYGHNSDELVEALRVMRIGFSAMNMEAALEAARSWHNYRRRGGGRD
jgi:predicted nucleic acid-binding protein